MAQRKPVTNGRPRSLPEQTRRFWAQFAPEDRVCVVIVADPDSLASALAVRRLLWRKVASVTVACINQISRPDNQTMVELLGLSLVPFSSIKPEDFSKLVMVDGQPGHNEATIGLHFHVVIDHHPLHPATAQVDFSDVRPRYGANSTIMTEYLKGAKIKPSARLATALLFGIKTDTAAFQRPIIEEDVKAFQFLHPKGNHSVLRKIELSEMHQRDLAFLRRALDRLTIRKKCALAHVGVVKNPDTLVLIADFFLRVDAVESSVISGVYGDKLIVIMRHAALRGNAGKLVDQAFGALGSAGGHKAMARAELPLDQLKEFAGDVDDESLSRFVIRRIQRPGAKLVRPAAKNQAAQQKNGS